MPTIEVIQAWKDEEYRDGLTAEQRAQLPEHPAGTVEVLGSAMEENGWPHFSGQGCCRKTTI